MERDELPAKVRSKVHEWLGDFTTCHFWKFDETFIVLAKVTGGDGNIYCLRIFPVGDSLQLSQDNILYA